MQGSGQTKLFSFLETASTRVFMYLISVGIQMVVFPLYGMPVVIGESFQIAAIFMCTSMFFSFCFRRFFNSLNKKGIGVEKDV